MPFLSARSFLRAWMIALLVVASASSAPIEIIPPELHGSIQPQVAADREGSIHVVFGRESVIYHVASKGRGQPFSKATRVAEIPKLALGRRRGPRITAMPGLITISAISHQAGNLSSWISRDRGVTWKQTATINEVRGSAREGLHAMTGNGTGALFTTWLDLRNGMMELWGAASSDGGSSWGSNVLIYKSPEGHICECCHPSAVMDASGRIAVMWRNWKAGARDMYVTISTDSGKAFGEARKLGVGTWTLHGCPMDGGDMTFAANGKLVTVWRRENTAHACVDGEAEEPLGTPGFQPIVIQNHRELFYLWENGNQIMSRAGRAAPVRFAANAMFAAACALPHGAIVVFEADRAGRKTLLADFRD